MQLTMHHYGISELKYGERERERERGKKKIKWLPTVTDILLFMSAVDWVFQLV